MELHTCTHATRAEPSPPPPPVCKAERLRTPALAYFKVGFVLCASPRKAWDLSIFVTQWWIYKGLIKGAHHNFLQDSLYYVCKDVLTTFLIQMKIFPSSTQEPGKAGITLSGTLSHLLKIYRPKESIIREINNDSVTSLDSARRIKALMNLSNFVGKRLSKMAWTAK